MSAPAPEGWEAFTEEMGRWMSPDWSKCARDFATQPWVRLILLVDAHALLCTPQATEKIAMTMADLAEGREGERAGWEAINDHARTQRMDVVAAMVDRAGGFLPAELLPFFLRSIEPMSHMTAQ